MGTYTGARGSKANGFRVGHFLKFFKSKNIKIYCDGKKYVSKRDDNNILFQFEIKDNVLYLFTSNSTGRNRYVVMSVIKIEEKSTKYRTVTKKRTVISPIYSDWKEENAIEYAKQEYSKKYEIERKRKDIYSYDIEIRKLFTPRIYEIIDFKDE